MNLINKLIKVFVRDKIDIGDTNTTLSPYDVSDVYLPSIRELSKEQNELLLQYKKEINLNDIASIIKYNENTSKEGERLANILIKELYELNEVVRKDNKNKKELEEIDINLSIKNIKIFVIRELLYNLKCNTILKTLAIQFRRQEYEKKEHKLIDFFSPAARIKRNMELRNLIESENRSKITIKTITHQIYAINNAIYTNNIYQNRMDIYNKLINCRENYNIRKGIYIFKLNFYLEIMKKLNCNFTRLLEIKKLLALELDKDIETIILENFAITEIELEKYIFENKDKMIEEYMTKVINLKDITVTSDNKDRLLEETEHLQVIEEVFKEYLPKILYRDTLYKLKFNILTFDINNQTEEYTKFDLYLPRNDYYKEIDHYIKIIFDKINNINQGISPIAKKLQENNLLKKAIKYLNSYLKSADGKYRYADILFNRNLLALLLAFDDHESFNNFFKEYKYFKNGTVVNKSINLPWINFEWDNYLPLETIYTLYEIDGRDKPPFYDIYKLYHKIEKKYNFTDIYYYLPEGIQAIDNTSGDKELLSHIKEKSDNKVVVLPSTLKRISGSIFGESVIRDVILNDGLLYIGNFVFLGQKLRSITFPSSLSVIEAFAFNLNELKELVFDDYKNSRLLYFLLFDDTDRSKKILKRIFSFNYDEDYRKIINSKLEKIILCDKEDGNIELTKEELFDIYNISNNINEVRSNLVKLIERKTSIDIIEYGNKILNK